MIKGQLNKAIKSTKAFHEYQEIKTKMSKEIENILFDVYEKGVKQEDCDLTEVYEKLIKLLNQNKDE